MLIDGLTNTPTGQIKNSGIEHVTSLPSADLYDGREVVLTANYGSYVPGPYTYLSGAWIQLVSKNYVDTAISTAVSNANVSDVDWSVLRNVPTTVAGHGIQDVYTKTESDTRIQTIIGTAPANLDTLGEITTQLANEESAVAALVTTVAQKANQSTTYTKSEVDALLAAKVVPYDVASATSGKPTASSTLMMFVSPRAFTLPTNLSGSIAKALAAATAQAVFTISKNGSQVASFTFAAASAVATFSNQAAIQVAAGDLITINAPDIADLTLSDIAFTLDATI